MNKGNLDTIVDERCKFVDLASMVSTWISPELRSCGFKRSCNFANCLFSAQYYIINVKIGYDYTHALALSAVLCSQNYEGLENCKKSVINNITKIFEATA